MLLLLLLQTDCVRFIKQLVLQRWRLQPLSVIQMYIFVAFYITFEPDCFHVRVRNAVENRWQKWLSAERGFRFESNLRSCNTSLWYIASLALWKYYWFTKCYGYYLCFVYSKNLASRLVASLGLSVRPKVWPSVCTQESACSSFYPK